MPKNLLIVLSLVYILFCSSVTSSMQQQLYPAIPPKNSWLVYKLLQVQLMLSTNAIGLIDFVTSLLSKSNSLITYSHTSSAYTLIAAAVQQYTTCDGIEAQLLELLTRDMSCVEAFIYCLPEASRTAAACLLLISALKYKRDHVVVFFINAGFPVNTCDEHGNTLIHQALLYNNDHSQTIVQKVHAIVIFLVEHKAEINSENYESQTFLDVLEGMLSKNKLYEMTRNYLVLKGARYGTALNKCKVQEIHKLLRAKSLASACKIIASGGLSLDDPYDDKNGYTLLMYSSGNGLKNMVELLLKYGACADKKCKVGNLSAIDIAIKKHEEDIKKLLLDYVLKDDAFLREAVEVKVESTSELPADSLPISKAVRDQAKDDNCLLM